MGERLIATRHRGAFVRRSHQRYSAVHGREPNLVDGNDAENRRSHPAPGDDVHPADLFVYLLQFCRGSGIVLHHTESFQYCAILLQQTTTGADARETAGARKTKIMTPKELLDTILGYLGFV